MSYDVLVATSLDVKGYLELNLLWLESTYTEGVLFVDELDCYDWTGCSEWHCFADAAAQSRSAWQS